jgi:chloride channel 3/4/5
MWENVFLLILTATIKIVLTAWTFGMMVSLYLRMACIHSKKLFLKIPAGIFLPTIAIGACLGRAVGLLT